MIRASGLYGRALIDLDSADRVGYIDEIIVDTYGPCIAGFVVSSGRSVLGSRKHSIVPAEAIYAIGPDALTMRSGGRTPDDAVYLNSLPRLSELTGRKMISFGGKFLGTVEDALIDEHDGRIIGYPLDGVGLPSGLERLFSLGLKPERSEYVRANADLRVGARLIVVPDDAVASMNDVETPALPEGTPETAKADEPEAERKSHGRRHRQMAVPFTEHDEMVAAGETTRDGHAAPSEAPVDEFTPANEIRIPEPPLHDDLIETSQIPVGAMRSRRSRAEREDQAS